MNTSLNSPSYRILIEKLKTGDCPLNDSSIDLNQELEEILLVGGEKRYQFLKWLLVRLYHYWSRVLCANEDLAIALSQLLFKLKFCKTLEESVKFVEADYPIDEQLEMILVLINSANTEENVGYSEIKKTSSLIPDSMKAEMIKLQNTGLTITPKSDIASYLSELLKEISGADKDLESVSNVQLAVDAESVCTAINDLSNLCLSFAKTHEGDFRTLLMNQPKKVRSNLPCEKICSELADTIQVRLH
ncbi:hypothetical protein CHUAL_012725 [Chamberlinius hualienensis]